MLRVVLFPQPLAIALVLQMFRVRHGLQKIVEAGDTTHIFRWAGADGGEASGQLQVVGRWEDLFQCQDVPPAVAKIVFSFFSSW